MERILAIKNLLELIRQHREISCSGATCTIMLYNLKSLLHKSEWDALTDKERHLFF